MCAVFDGASPAANSKGFLPHRLYISFIRCIRMPSASSYFTPFVRFRLNGKVYTIQDPRLPFAAVHGDPDVVATGKTRFGPTALPLPLLERFNISTFPDFVKVINPDLNLLHVYMDLLNTRHMRNYVLRNFLFEVPILNVKLFAKVTITASLMAGALNTKL